MSIPYFNAVDLKINFPDEEKKLLDNWYNSGLVNKYLQKNSTSQKYFSFLDGPITANNPMGVHHAWGRTYKDLWQRYKNMNGFKQRFQNGFDCQGLWVEVEVEKELKLQTKKDIENLIPNDQFASLDKFVQLCKDRVIKYSGVQTEQSKRLGYFMDWDHSYFTMSDENNYTIWHFLKVCWEKGWIYKGHDSVPWCPRCETAISQHEMLTEDYKELTHESIYIAFPLVDKENEFLLVWTTTPWTIPANIAVAVDKSIKYSLVDNGDGKKYWLASDLVEKLFPGKSVIKTVEGGSLAGNKYKGPFDHLDSVQKVSKEAGFHTVVLTDSQIMPISTTEGTGMVHTAVSAGEEDFQLGKKLGLPMIPVIADNADYLPGLGEFSGKNAKTDPHIILGYLESQTNDATPWVFKIEKYTHRYPACWRCKAELVWKVADEWYISMDKKDNKLSLRQGMVKVAKKIKWLPEFGLDRELDWLSNMHDWLISKKNRYWGLALPIYECGKCGNFEVIGSKDELKQRAIEGWDKFDGHSPHKPWIDLVTIKCGKCNETVKRIPDVGNPWLDAGIVAFSTISADNTKPLYPQNMEEWKKWFPAEFITESFPGQFKNWFYSLIAMSTVLTGSPSFKTVLGFATLLGSDGRPMHKSWGNSIEFNEGAEKIGVDVMRWMFVRQNPADNLIFGFNVADEVRRSFHLKIWNIYNFFITYANLDGWTPEKSKKSNKLLDKWINSRLAETLQITTKSLESYQVYIAAREIERFVDDLSNWYIRRSRERIGPAAENEKDKVYCYSTLYHVLVTLSQLLAPLNPFISELIYTNLTKEESVHLSNWPKLSIKPNQDLNSKMALIREIIENAHSERKRLNIPVRQPLQRLITDIPNVSDIANYSQFVQDELNVKEWVFKQGQSLKNEFDTNITPALEEEAKTRELIRNIQSARRDQMLTLADSVNVKATWIPSSPELLKWLKSKSRINKIEVGEFLVVKS